MHSQRGVFLSKVRLWDGLERVTDPRLGSQRAINENHRSVPQINSSTALVSVGNG